MKVKIKENIVGLDFSYTIGEEVTVDKAAGDSLILAGYAEEVKPAAKKTGGKK